MEGESEKDIVEKLQQYYTQFEQVEELLKLDPTNPQFLKLRDDLTNVINLTQALFVTMKQNQSENDPTSSYNPHEKFDVNQDEEEGDDEDDDDLSEVSTLLPPLPAKTGPITVGECVEVTGAERIYTGVVTEIIHDTEYKIKYFEFDSEVSLPLTSLSRITNAGFHPKDVKVGLKCQCKYASDRVYYAAIVTELTKHGCMITYPEYGNSEEVPLEYLQPAVSIAKIGVSETSQPQPKAKAKDPSKSLPSIIPIPANLVILPTDTEEV